MNITSEQYEYLNNIYTGRVKYRDRSESYNKQTVKPEVIDNTDKIYVFPNCTIKKLPLRKWIKDIGAKQVFKPTDATCLITKDNLVLDRWEHGTPISVFKNYIIKEGVYYNKYNKSQEIVYKKDVKVDEHNFARFLYTIDSSRAARGYWSMTNEEHDFYTNECKKHEAVYNVSFSTKSILEDHVNSVLDKNVKLVNQLDLQQVLYDWEVVNKVRTDLSTFNWDGVYDILCSNADWSLAIMMIKKGDISSLTSKLIACLFDEKICAAAKSGLYRDIFVRIPDVKECIDTRTFHRRIRYTPYILSDLLVKLDDRNISFDLVDIASILDIEIDKHLHENNYIITFK